jgi:signal transduction histidine kinase
MNAKSRITSDTTVAASPAAVPEDFFTVPRFYFFLRLRLAGLAGAAVLTLVGRLFVPNLAVVPLLLTVTVLTAINLALAVYARREETASPASRARRMLVSGQTILDMVGLTVLLHLAGGVENPFFPFYAFSVIIAGALLTRRLTLGRAALATVLYSGMIAGEALGWLPHHHLAGFQDPLLYQRGPYLAAQAFGLAAICFLAGEATVQLVGRLRARARELAELNQRTEARTTQLRELNNQLRAANEECAGQRQRIDATYAELQNAYDRLEVRSHQLVELNNQLRAANEECKVRREELTDLTARLQEAYRRLETRNERMADLNEQLRAANERCQQRGDELAVLNERLAHANAKLLELDDARAQFTLLVTHELRAPVAAIQSYLKLILEGYVAESKVRETLEKAERRAMEQLALIADLLELGRIQSADAHGLVKPVQVDQLLAEQLDLMIARAQERNITVNTQVESNLPPVTANPDQIKSLWNNLISNAIKYNVDGGRVEITLCRSGNRLEGRVSDTGIGIPAEAMPRLFSEFFRADNAKAVSRMGTGLGLSIVKEIVERSGGKITVESEVNKGTTFNFWFPFAPPAAPASNGANGAAATAAPVV